MLMVDPLFQRVLVKECQSRKIPVIFDEVFTGFWRLGVESAAELLCCQPDIACFAKLMTGGIVPLAATLATCPVFDAFVGDSKVIIMKLVIFDLRSVGMRNPSRPPFSKESPRRPPRAKRISKEQRIPLQ
ncbi:adenosylmethionine-8-amino-7-oxononanoate transaminase [Actinidia rufa]|uniref:Adenosylmethionine-8-amino-7-oxononanoate transaminase n=1 Tax=Actinidia rufa TaxID=165716 RepID=A0A7J0DR76_9ERIC|nr:adenosylmethionine-8-amino-7-oxononanoate transaminase [Actinidia rufa]